MLYPLTYDYITIQLSYKHVNQQAKQVIVQIYKSSYNGHEDFHLLRHPTDLHLYLSTPSLRI